MTGPFSGGPAGAARGRGGEVNHPTSRPEGEGEHALLWALAEFREELGRLFDEQVALARAANVAPAVAAAVPPPMTPEAAPVPVSVPTTPPAPAPVAVAPPEPVRSWHREPPPAPAPEPAPAGRGNDPRQRLDALARLLDKRLKQATPGASEP